MENNQTRPSIPLTRRVITGSKLAVTLAILVVGLTLSWYAKWHIDQVKSGHIQSELQHLVENYSVNIEREIARDFELVNGLASLFEASIFVTEDEFNRYIAGQVHHHKDVLMLAWAGDDRTGPDASSNTRITGQDPVNPMEHQAEADDQTGVAYSSLIYPLRLIWPESLDRTVSDEDLISHPVIIRAMKGARVDDSIRSGILMQKNGGLPTSLLVTASVNQQLRKSVDQSVTLSQAGVVFGIFDLQKMVAEALRDDSFTNLRLELIDYSDSDSPRILVRLSAMASIRGKDGSRTQPFTLNKPYSVSYPVDIPDRTLILSLMPSKEFLESYISGYSNYTMMVGIIITFLLLYFYYRANQFTSMIEDSEHMYRNLAEKASDIIGLVKQDGEVVYGSPSVVSTLGYQPDEISRMNLVDFLHPEDVPVVLAAINDLINRNARYKLTQARAKTAQGDWRWLETSMSRGLPVDGEPTVHCMVRDIDSRKCTELALERTTRALRTLSAGNTVMIRSRSERTLINELPGILVSEGGYSLVWIGRFDDEEKVRVLSYASADKQFSLADEERIFQVPETAVIKKAMSDSGKSLIWSPEQQDVEDPFHKIATEKGFQSAVTFRIEYQKDIFGILTIFERQPDIFDLDEIEFLIELVGDLGYGIKAFRTSGELDITAQNLTESESRFRVLIDKQTDGVIVINDQREILFCNPAATLLFDQRGEDLVGRTFDLAYVPGDITEVQVVRPDKSIRYVETHSAAIRWHGQQACLISLHDITDQLSIDQERTQHAKSLQAALEQAIAAIAQTVEKRDPYTSGHQQRVAKLAVEIGRELGLDDNQLHGLYLGALIHDIGKVYVPSEILNRPGKLSNSEFELIKSHPEVGYEIVKGIDFPWPVADMIRQHHEKLDGSGYPQGLRNGEICREARIIAVADVVEAMSSHRPYRPSLGVEPALEEIQRHKGTRYEEEAVDACTRLFSENIVTLESLLQDN